MREVARGGMGVVYLAHHKLLDKHVELKVCQVGKSISRFQREARLLAKISSPHVVTIYDFDRLPDGRAMIAMEWLKDGDLYAAMRELDGKIEWIVDCGQSQVGIESTVVDLTVAPPRLLRPGMIHAESLAAVLDEVSTDVIGQDPGVLRSPGLLTKHYAPHAKLVMLRWQDEADLHRQLEQFRGEPRRHHVIAHTHIPLGSDFGCVSVIPHDAEAFARALYAELHRCDDEGAETIIVEAVPENAEWKAIADRLRRASAGRTEP